MLKVIKGDYGYILAFRVVDADGAPYNLAEYSAKLKVWKNAEMLVDAACEAGVILGMCYYTVVVGDFDTMGTYLGEIELVKPGVIESTLSFDVVVADSR